MKSILSLILIFALSANAEEKKPNPKNKPAQVSAPAPGNSDEVNVDQIQEKYWAQGEDSEVGVVQNRTYSKAKKVELGVNGGMLMSDPFLDTKTLGASVGYHFNEYFGLHLIGWKSYVQPSSALQTFEQFRGATANTNPTRSYYGTELTTSLLYGKLSLIGKKIIYYDLHLLTGVGLMKTESGNSISPSAGIGQRFFLSQKMSLRLDYRLMYYKETIIEKQITTKLGQPQGTRSNWTNTITLGVDFFFDFLK